MIQATINNQSATAFVYSIFFYLNVADKIVGTPTFISLDIGDDTYYAISFPYFLFKLKSQQTGKTKIFTRTGHSFPVGTNLNKYERQIGFNFKYSVNPSSTENLSAAEILVGTDEFPLGFYDITIYQINSSGELNPDNATTTLYNGLLNMKATKDVGASTDFRSVIYTEYTTNDADTDSVYITN